MTTARRALAWAAYAAWAAAVWTVSSRSRPAEDLHWPWAVPDKLAHGVEYLAGGVLGTLAFATLPRLRSPALAAVVACTVWGFVDEIHQGFVPRRTTDPWDLAADAAGAAAGAAAVSLALRRLVRTSR